VRRWTLVMIILLFLAIVTVALYQVLLATRGEPRLPGPSISPTGSTP
jgi:hypothetical protein